MESSANMAGMLAKALTGHLKSDSVKDERQSPAGVDAYHVPRDMFRDVAKTLKSAGARLCAEWATDDAPLGGGFGIYACYANDGEYLIVKTHTPLSDPAFPSLAKHFVPAYRFERQMESLMGVLPEGLPDARPWIKHEDWPKDAYPLRKSFDIDTKLARVDGEYEWVRVDGEGIYEIPVGPVHAGIIEPGHFRFHAAGESVINLEEKLGYVHKGIEKRFESLSWRDGSRLAGRVSGDTTVAHAATYCMALESMSGCRITERAAWLRALMLERERIANHLGDIGAIANDTAFTFLLYQFTRLKETIVKTNRAIFGHRLMMDAVIPGGTASDVKDGDVKLMRAEMAAFIKEFEKLMVIYEENPSFQDRIYSTGALEPGIAKELCVVGFVARASNLMNDCRVHYPFGPYLIVKPRTPLLRSGDVHARAWVRIEEIRESVRLIGYILENLPEGKTVSPCSEPPPGAAGFAAVEGWRGEILYWMRVGEDAKPHRCMVRDPSSVNWLGLEQCVKGSIVPDFPLCNKSFNQSYSGNDL